MSNVQSAMGTGVNEMDMLDMGELFGEEQAQEPVKAGPGMSMFRDVPLTVTLEVASTEVTLGELSDAEAGDVLPLDKAVGEPLDVKVNGVLFAKAEVVMVNGKYGLKFVSTRREQKTDA
ncbi:MULTISPECIES: FliM/FliN family flagellar motor switch protein [Rheinheimera]|uniref:Flagellar motor switch protein FliN n=1 Tax=Rheinheimera marina TaxID=1774958 RepID=A0ABV9JIC6_9GAMM